MDALYQGDAPVLSSQDARNCLFALLPKDSYPRSELTQLRDLSADARLLASRYIVALAASLHRYFPRDSLIQGERYTLSNVALELTPGLPCALLEKGDALLHLGALWDSIEALEECSGTSEVWKIRCAAPLVSVRAKLEGIIDAYCKKDGGEAVRAQGLAAPLSALKLKPRIKCLPDDLISNSSATLASAKSYLPTNEQPEALRALVNALSPPPQNHLLPSLLHSVLDLSRASRPSFARLGIWNIECREEPPRGCVPRCIEPKAANLASICEEGLWDVFAVQEVPQHPAYAGLFRKHLQPRLPGWALEEVDVGSSHTSPEEKSQGENALFGHDVTVWSRAAPASVFPQTEGMLDERIFSRSPALLLLRNIQVEGQEGSRSKYVGGSPSCLALLSVHLKSFDSKLKLERTKTEIERLSSHAVPWMLKSAHGAFGGGVEVVCVICGDFNAAAPGSSLYDEKTFAGDAWNGLLRQGFHPSFAATATNMKHFVKCGGKEYDNCWVAVLNTSAANALTVSTPPRGAMGGARLVSSHPFALASSNPVAQPLSPSLQLPAYGRLVRCSELEDFLDAKEALESRVRKTERVSEALESSLKVLEKDLRQRWSDHYPLFVEIKWRGGDGGGGEVGWGIPKESNDDIEEEEDAILNRICDEAEEKARLKAITKALAPTLTTTLTESGGGSIRDTLPPHKLYLVLHAIGKERNIGSLMRSAVAFNVSEILVCGSNTRSVSTFGSKGTHRYAKIREFPGKGGLQCAAAWLRENGVDLFGLEIDTEAKNLTVNWGGAHRKDSPSPLFKRSSAIMPGNETDGLTPFQKSLCAASGGFIYVPQFGNGTASLNVGVACAIAMCSFAVWANFPERKRHPCTDKFLVDAPLLRRGEVDELEMQTRRATRAEARGRGGDEEEEVGVADLYGGEF